jgi:hypothetical protein
MTDKKTILDWAMEYRSKGINPVKVLYKGKFPAKGETWEEYQTERVTIERLEEWFGPDACFGNISAVTGPISSGLTVLDFDSEKTYRWWSDRNQELAAELPTSTSGRGYHIFFRSALNKDDTSSYQDMDLKAKGLISLPPSMHKSGKRYKWLVPLPGNISELPLLNPLDWNLEEFTDGDDGSEGSEGLDGKEGVGKRVGKIEELMPETQAAIEEAIEKTLPKAYGQRYGLIWRCCQHLLAFEEIKDKSWEEIMIIGDIWHKRALPNIEHKSLLMTQARFKNAWGDVKYPVGEAKSLEIAVEDALNSKTPMPELEEFKGDEVMEKIIRLCFSLQKLAGPDDNWFIPTNKAPELFGITHSWLAIMLGRLEGKIINKTKKHTKFKCSRYRFIGPSMALLRKDTDCPGGTPL